MTPADHPYRTTRVAFATMHGKANLARHSFHNILGASVITTPDLDTDQFGTFSGEIPRTLEPRAAARVKARLGIQVLGTPYALASEGSFASPWGMVVEHHEILMFLDDERGLELVESSTQPSPLPTARVFRDVETALQYATAVRFPSQRLIIRAGSHGDYLDKSADSLDTLAETVLLLIRAESAVTLEPDFRAHHCPSRASIITALAATMAHRLATPCPECRTPGFGRVDIERGLLCADCGEPTHVIAADILGCGGCAFTVRVGRADRTAAPSWCDGCNP